MRWQAVGSRVVFLLGIALAVGWPLVNQASAQGQNQQTPTVAGVIVDGQGTLQRKIVPDAGGRTMLQRRAAAQAAMPPEIAKPSKFRKVSLIRLEKAIRASNGVLTEEMRYLAGLLRLRYVFFYPDSGDIVIAGPAEGWVADPVGRVVGITSGRPVLQLQDLVVALRAYPPGGDEKAVITCSIDPTQEGLAAMQNFLRRIGSYATPAQTASIVNGLRTSLGLQEISIGGISPNTHFAQVLVEADYRMKLIGIGLERPAVRLAAFVDRASPSQISRNALCRWYFVPDYQCVRASDDGLAMELVGDGVRLVGENEAVTAGGERRQAAGGSRASQAFVLEFTKRYPELAAHSPVYAELRNLIDMSVAAAYIQKEDLCHKAGWAMEFFGDERALAVETYNAPKQVESAVAALWKGNTLMTPIGGGVHIQAEMALDSDKLLPDEGSKVGKLRETTKLKLAEGQWWWD